MSKTDNSKSASKKPDAQDEKPKDVFQDFCGKRKPLDLSDAKNREEILVRFDSDYDNFQLFQQATWLAVRKYMSVFFGMVWAANNSVVLLARLKEEYEKKGIKFKDTDKASAGVAKIVAAKTGHENGFDKRKASSNKQIFDYGLDKIETCKSDRDAAEQFFELCEKAKGLENMRLPKKAPSKPPTTKLSKEELEAFHSIGDTTVKALPSIGGISVPDVASNGTGRVVLLLGVTASGDRVDVKYCLGDSLTSEARQLLGQVDKEEINKLMSVDPVVNPTAEALEMAQKILKEQAQKAKAQEGAA
jgi:hypothetical protein